jgi:peptidoglycan/LPS O-acetylase OafA/YrhL
MKEDNRIKIIDGFRFISIISVILFHFYSRYTQPANNVNYYPYNDEFEHYFNQGHFGVKFFFIISGFVIFYTMERSASFSSFFYKRFIRLFPSMFLCSIVTFIFVELADREKIFPFFHSSTILSFLPSWTFTPPLIWNLILNRNDIEVISGSYWTLWVEVSFYLLAGAIFFINSGNFLSNWVKALTIVTFLRIITYSKVQNIFDNGSSIKKILLMTREGLHFFAVSQFMIYFTLGILFYTIFDKKKISRFNFSVILALSGLELYLLEHNSLRVLFILTILLFVIFIYKGEYLNFLKANLITRIGMTSYTLYLIHESIGVILINKLGAFTGPGFVTGLIPVIVIFILILFSELVYRFYEVPLNRYFKKRINNSTASQTV